MKTTTLTLLLALACGCKTHTPTENAPTKDTRVIRIETDPPGMRVYFGISGNEESARHQREYVGESPCKLTVRCDEDGRFLNEVSSFAHPKAVFEAEPPAGTTNLFAQQQVFVVPALFVHPPPIPQAVFFDMHKPPP